MTYATLSRYVCILWGSARYGYDVEPVYKRWIVERVTDHLTIAGLLADDALDQYRDHLAFDYRLDPTETPRFNFWWEHITTKGFNVGNPLAHLHTRKVGAK